MDSSIFMDESSVPLEHEVQKTLGKSYAWFRELEMIACNHDQQAIAEWHYSKAGWNYRLKGKKKVLIYMMPLADRFRISFVLSARAVKAALTAPIQDSIKKIIAEARTYAEGTGFRIDVNDKKTANDVEHLLLLKLKS